MSDSKIILESLSPVCDIQAFVEENDASLGVSGKRECIYKKLLDM